MFPTARKLGIHDIHHAMAVIALLVGVVVIAAVPWISTVARQLTSR